MMKPGFDPALHRDVRSDALAGRKINAYRQALEAQGFMFVPAQRLPKLRDGTRPTAGQWRNARLRMGFTDDDVLSMFPGGPQELFEWVEAQRLRRRIHASRR